MGSNKNDIPDSLEWLSGSIDTSEPTTNKKTIKGGGYYSIPTRQYSKATGEVEDIHITYTDIAEEPQRDKIMGAIKRVDSMTVGELSKMAGYARIGILLKEAAGKEITEPERTIRDIDITTLALFIMNGTTKVIGKGQGNTKEDLQNFIDEKRKQYKEPD